LPIIDGACSAQEKEEGQYSGTKRRALASLLQFLFHFP
jgi:hypothetical protein